MIQPIGYFKMWRELYSRPIWLNSTPEQKTILIAIMGMVNFKPKQWEWNGEKFEAQRGQVVTSLDKIKENCGKGITTQNIRTALKRFEKLGFLTNESTKTGRLITVDNWDFYQGNGEEPNKGDNKDLTKSQQRPNKDLTPREEVKKERSKENIYITIEHLKLTDTEHQKLVDKFGDKAVEEKLEYAKNYRKIKSYNSLYLTLNNWLKKDLGKVKEKREQNGPIGVIQSDPANLGKRKPPLCM